MIREMLNNSGMSILHYKEAGFKLTVTLALDIMAKANSTATLAKKAKNLLSTILSIIKELKYTT